MPLVTLHLWQVAPRAVPAAVLRMATCRGPLARAQGLRFARLIGTGDAESFALRRPDLCRWGLLAAWDHHGDAESFERGTVVSGWNRLAQERVRVRMRPLSSTGRWAGRRPFAGPTDEPAQPYDGPLAVVTRARLRAGHAATFWRAVPAVAADLRHAGGLRLALPFSEFPLAMQATFSVWESAAAARDYAYHRSPHQAVVRRTAELGWYAESLFARLAVLDSEGTYRGRPL